MYRTAELYSIGITEYHKYVENEIGENNAIIAACAALLAQSERWPAAGPCLVPDDGPDEGPTVVDHPCGPDQATRQLSLGEW